MPGVLLLRVAVRAEELTMAVIAAEAILVIMLAIASATA
jgi:hypothetical protein